ncbi:MAG: SUMF1/EgtB/PvdO family nonheme iron enzyme [Anaerolineae bacterium]|nr:SUMF1/EgtB/PvdO family nonheme iron enzyme [Anaerolineae bacterium]
MVDLSPEQITELVDLLDPLTGNESARRALLSQALGLRSPVLRTLDFHGPTYTFVINMVNALLNHGEAIPGKPALVLLLEKAREQLGYEKHERIDALITAIDTPSVVIKKQREEEAAKRVGNKVGAYYLEERLASTLTTDVYRVYHERRREEPLALKVLRQFKSGTYDAKRFRREIAVLQALDNPHIARHLDSGEWEGLMYLVMPFYPHGTLEQRVRAQGPVALDAAERVLWQMADALEAAHQKNIIHRDVKPSNVLFDAQDNAVLADFGVAMMSDATSYSSGFLGTAMYAAPEQFHTEEVDIRTDVYSLGLTLYYMLTGQPPFKANGLALMALRIRGEVPPHPCDVYHDLPRGVGDVIVKVVQDTREARYVEPRALAEAFGEAVKHVRLAPVYELIRMLPDQEAKDKLGDLAKHDNDVVVREFAVDALVTPAPLKLLPQARPTSLPFEPIWIEIPAGPFLMGSTEEHVARLTEEYEWDWPKNELPQNTVDLPAYRISKYPVTYAQFKPFVESDGYANSDYWTEAGWRWREKEKIETPLYWHSSKWHIDDYSVVGVSWYEAYAYCRWLGERLGYEVCLPTEAEWEKAARGTKGLIYPWGDKFDANKCNVEENGIGHTTSVRKYSPQGDSPYGCANMAGNVWEWVLSEYREYPYGDDYGRNDHSDASSRIVRGGSFILDARYARTAYRDKISPDDRDYDNGFRLITHTV